MKGTVMKKAVLLVLSLALAGCDGLAPNATTEPQKQESAAPDFAAEAEAVMKKALDDWVFGDANYKLESNADIRFGDLDYNTGVPLTSYEIVAAKEVRPDMAEVAVRLVFPTRGGVHEIKKSVSYTVWKTEEGYWQTGPAIDASVKRGVSVEQ
jgi:hypothetical protein